MLVWITRPELPKVAMDHHRECAACNATTEAKPPNKAFWGLIVAFWFASLALGVGASRNGWSFVLVASWAALASSVVLLARRATSWTCAECGSSVVPPVTASSQPQKGSFRGMPRRHA
jgi:hypothetical protein